MPPARPLCPQERTFERRCLLCPRFRLLHLLSTQGNATLGGLTFGDDDLVEYDPATDTATLLFDGGSLFSNTSEDIDGVAILASDVLVGGDGDDILIGGAGSDVFDYDDASQGVDTIIGFEPGAGGDTLNIANLLVGYTDGVDNINDFVNLLDNGTDTTVRTDADGGADGFTDLVVLQGVSGLDLSTLLTDGNLDVIV